MKKQLISLLSIFALSIVLTTGCQKGTYEELVTTSGEVETSTYVVEVETTIGEPETPQEIETTTGEPETTPKNDKAKYDTDKINITEWEEYIVDPNDRYKTTMFRPKKIEVEGIEYTYTYTDGNRLMAITGIDGTDIKLEHFPESDCYIRECKNGRIVKYIKKNSDKFVHGREFEIIGFEHDGKIYTYSYDLLDRIRDISDENGTIVAKYIYSSIENGTSIEVINYTDDNIGDINSLRYTGHYVDEATGFSFYFNKVYNVVNQENVELIEMFDPMENTGEEEKYTTTFNPYGKEIEVLDWHGNSLNSIRPKEIIADNKKYVYEYEYHGFRSSKKVFDGDSLVEEVLYEYGRDGMDMPILTKEIHKDYEISYTWQRDREPNCWITGFIYDGKEYFYQEGDEEYSYWVKYICDENNNKVAEYEYVENDAGIIECRVINYTEDNIGDINPIRYEESYCDSETGIIASHSSYYYVWKNDEEIEYVVLRPYLGE